MPCGCSGGKWTPPTESKDAAAKTADQPKPPAVQGPAAPGYYHTSK